ncbi:hypothetical protein SETIT_1G254700v2 [Setaria italica]|uniref:Uncharacterized protein n=2 Tax=Setaria TaxID=4554 RepID=A0A368PPH5_SETIT|nr:hypothetical protein SETIT_1G254700v2 [Setaria italica]TKW40638.1 hypothetical protein SEVIR_1G258900v2 [Setaria viridis]
MKVRETEVVEVWITRVSSCRNDKENLRVKPKGYQIV